MYLRSARIVFCCTWPTCGAMLSTFLWISSTDWTCGVMVSTFLWISWTCGVIVSTFFWISWTCGVRPATNFSMEIAPWKVKSWMQDIIEF
ncbi:hypothetical protein B0H16DRAFT_1543572 [Mycena metata]|uniref:Uncharacterized protein n=1 Tax=Mycena metata TaxID=1033252 RepID=A0AAD7NCK7_9AGAR|nr:hypothetical protein B0H16DRAFT_1543572 [Mycena metata]